MDQDYISAYAIPANYTDSGKLFGGLVETRNAVETVFLLLLLGYPELFLLPLPGTMRIVVMVVTLLPLGVLGAMGIDGDSLFQFMGHIISYWLRRRILHMRRVGYHYDPAQLKKPEKTGREKKSSQPKTKGHKARKKVRRPPPKRRRKGQKGKARKAGVRTGLHSRQKPVQRYH